MRDILFRGKNALLGDWVEGDLFCDHGNAYPKALIANVALHEDEHGEITDCGVWIRVIPETLGQYTGLKDRNGRRIFEGDIVRYIYEPGKGFWNANQLSVIRYGKTGFKFDGIKGTNKYGLMCGCLSSIPFNQDAENIPEFEVIGNIHDNPELIPEIEEEMRRDG